MKKAIGTASITVVLLFLTTGCGLGNGFPAILYEVLRKNGIDVESISSGADSGMRAGYIQVVPNPGLADRLVKSMGFTQSAKVTELDRYNCMPVLQRARMISDTESVDVRIFQLKLSENSRNRLSSSLGTLSLMCLVETGGNQFITGVGAFG